MSELKQKRPEFPYAVRPWSARGEELFEREGHYADFVAWEEWVSEHDEHGVLDGILTIDKVFVYSMMCDAIDEAVSASTGSGLEKESQRRWPPRKPTPPAPPPRR